MNKTFILKVGFFSHYNKNVITKNKSVSKLVQICPRLFHGCNVFKNYQRFSFSVIYLKKINLVLVSKPNYFKAIPQDAQEGYFKIEIYKIISTLSNTD